MEDVEYQPLLSPNPPRRSRLINIINTENVLCSCSIFYVLVVWFVLKHAFLPKPPVVEISHLTSLVSITKYTWKAKLHIQNPDTEWYSGRTRGSIAGWVFHEDKCLSVVKLANYRGEGDREEEIIVGFQVDSDKLPRSDYYEVSLFDLVLEMYTISERGLLWDRFLKVDCKDMVLLPVPDQMPGRMRCSVRAHRVFKYCDWCYKLSHRLPLPFMDGPGKRDFRKPCPAKIWDHFVS